MPRSRVSRHGRLYVKPSKSLIQPTNRRWLFQVTPSLLCQRAAYGAIFSASLIGVLGTVYHQFSWLVASIGLCLLAFESLQQTFYFMHLSADGQGTWGATSQGVSLQQPLLCTPWLLMFAVKKQGEGRSWIFIWCDSVDAAAWSRLRRIARTVSATPTYRREQEW